MRSLEIVIILIAGFILDLLLGDPNVSFHPVVLIGKLISACEKRLREFLPKTEVGEKLGGLLLLIIVGAISFLVPLAILLGVGRVSSKGRIALEIIMVWLILSCKTLGKEAMLVHQKVEQRDLEGSRRQIARIVGRDTRSLSIKEIIKACIETVAESTSDGIIGPMAAIAIGGAPLGFLYKAVNTLDSMVGYRNERYRFFGTASARGDDLLNLVPSRLTALIMVASAYVLRLDGASALAMWRRDGRKHLSPNSGNPEAACAGALGVQLGGDAYYFGKRYEKATLGDNKREVEPEDIKRAVRLMYLTSALGLLLMVLIRLTIRGIGGI